jgi:hypothetical protein
VKPLLFLIPDFEIAKLEFGVQFAPLCEMDLRAYRCWTLSALARCTERGEVDQGMPFGLSLSRFMPKIILTSGQYDMI